MSGVSCLYRRPSGIYVVRLVVPMRLRPAVRRGEIHVSTSLRDWNAAKLAALKIQMLWREKFMALDIERLTTVTPLLKGEGLISIIEAARVIGITEGELLSELLNDRTKVFVHALSWFGCVVPDLDEIERDYDGAFIDSSIKANSPECMRPMKGADMPLNDTAIRNAKPGEKPLHIEFMQIVDL